MKYAMSKANLSRRSRSGGMRRLRTFRRKYKSRRNVPSVTACSRSRLVAAQDAHVNRNTARAADGTNLLFLNGTQEFGLKIDGKFADLVEEYRPAVRNG